MRTFLCILFISLYSFVFSQETEEESFEKWRIAIATINSHIPAQKSDDQIVIPAWGLEFEYRINEKWAIMSNVEFELLSYVVIKENETLLEREFPFILSLLISRELSERWIFSTGYGREIEPNESFNLLVFNMNYRIPLPDAWDISPGVTYNTRFGGFDTYSFNIAFGKSF